MVVTLVELLPEVVKSEPLFKTEEEYQIFRESYMVEVCSKLREFDLARARSERDSMYHLLD